MKHSSPSYRPAHGACCDAVLKYPVNIHMRVQRSIMNTYILPPLSYITWHTHTPSHTHPLTPSHMYTPYTPTPLTLPYTIITRYLIDYITYLTRPQEDIILYVYQFDLDIARSDT
jgi:hypothetical protein